jgi:hypothetical protein
MFLPIIVSLAPTAVVGRVIQRLRIVCRALATTVTLATPASAFRATTILWYLVSLAPIIASLVAIQSVRRALPVVFFFFRKNDF